MNTQQPDDRAASEMIGVLMLIAIIVAAVAIVGVSYLSQPLPEKLPAVSMSITNDSRLIVISHDGGNTIPLDDMTIRIDDQPVPPDLWICAKCSATGDWSIGDTIQIDYSGHTEYPNKIDIIYKNAGQDYQLLASRYLWTMTPTQHPFPPM